MFHSTRSDQVSGSLFFLPRANWLRGRPGYLCIHCLLSEFAFPARDVDHIIPLSVAPDKDGSTSTISRAYVDSVTD